MYLLEDLLKRRGAEIRYGLAVLALATLFSQFVACGSQLYKVSMDGDHEGNEPSRLATENTDPNSKWYGIHAAEGWTIEPIEIKFSNDLNAAQIVEMKAAARLWEMALGREGELFKFTGNTSESADSFATPADSLLKDFNGMYVLKKWDASGISSSVLARTHWLYDASNVNKVSKASIVGNSQYYQLCNAFTLEGCSPRASAKSDSRTVANMRTVMAHEFGHLLGLSHVDDSIDRMSIMHTSLFIGTGIGQGHLSEGDIGRIRKMYQCSKKCKSVEQTAAEMQREDPSLKTALAETETAPAAEVTN